MLPVREDQVMLALHQSHCRTQLSSSARLVVPLGKYIKERAGIKRVRNNRGNTKIMAKRKKDLHGYGVFLPSNHYMCLVHLS